MKQIMKMSAITVLSAFLITGLSGCEELDSFLNEYKSGNVSVDDGTGLDVYFLDVGQADSAYITCGGEAMMIDGGNKADSDYVVSFLKSHNTDELKYVFATHVHEDHVGGLAGALTQCDVQRVFCSKSSYSSKAFNDFKDKAEMRGADIEIPEPGDEYSLGSCTITVLAPYETSDEENDNSIVLKLEYGDTSFLFTGDAQNSEEKDMLSNCRRDLKADVLKVGHHGSETSTGYEFLREVMPDYAVISVGKDNSYGHPDDSVISRLQDEGASIYRTDENGIIKVHSDGKEISVECEK